MALKTAQDHLPYEPATAREHGGCVHMSINQETAMKSPQHHIAVHGRAALLITALLLFTAAGAQEPASTGCGRISTVDVGPRQENLHRAQLQLVDGRNAGTTGQEVFRVSAGMHKLTIAENIDNTYLAISDRQRSSAKGEKTLMVNVEPDHIYYVAAWLDEAHRQEWATGDYWQPVVWKVAEQRCR